VRTGRAFSGQGASGFDGNDRFRAAYTAGDPGKPARISKRLQIQQNDTGSVIYFPVLEQIVARDVCLVSDADIC